MIVEASDGSAVEWTRSADYQPDPNRPQQGLIGLRPGGFQAALGDGSLRFLSVTLDPEIRMRL